MKEWLKIFCVWVVSYLLVLAPTPLFGQNPVVGGRATVGGRAVVGGGTTATVAQAHLALQFNGTSDTLQSSAPLNLGSTSVVTVAFWLYQNSFGNTDALALEESANFNTSPGAFNINPNSSTNGGFSFAVFTGSATYLTCFFTRPSGAAWHHYVLVLDITATNGACAGYVDGVSQSVTKNSGSTASTYTSYVLNVMSRGGSTLFNAGRITSIAIWGADESASAATLASCSTDPNTIDSSHLQHYWKIQQTSPETPTAGAVNLNVTGTTNVAGPC